MVDLARTRDLRGLTPQELPHQLSSREVEVLRLIAQGHENSEICRILYLTINTVKSHVRSAYRKIGATTRTEAIVWCYRSGLCETDVLA